jgi:hypothetical protein
MRDYTKILILSQFPYFDKNTVSRQTEYTRGKVAKLNKILYTFKINQSDTLEVF